MKGTKDLEEFLLSDLKTWEIGIVAVYENDLSLEVTSLS